MDSFNNQQIIYIVHDNTTKPIKMDSFTINLYYIVHDNITKPRRKKTRNKIKALIKKEHNPDTTDTHNKEYIYKKKQNNTFMGKNRSKCATKPGHHFF